MRFTALLPYLALAAPILAHPGPVRRAKSCMANHHGSNSTVSADQASGYASDNSTVLNSSFGSQGDSGSGDETGSSQLFAPTTNDTAVDANSIAPNASAAESGDGSAGTHKSVHRLGHHHHHHGGWNHTHQWNMTQSNGTSPGAPTGGNLLATNSATSSSSTAASNSTSTATATSSSTTSSDTSSTPSSPPSPAPSQTTDSNGVVVVTQTIEATTVVWVTGSGDNGAQTTASSTSDTPASSPSPTDDTPTTTTSVLDLSANPCQTDGCPTQTMPGGVSGNPGTPTATAASDAQTWVDLHNQLRAQYGAGEVVWNPTLAAYAQNWATNCQFKHTGGPYGENLAAGTGSLSIADGFKMWSDEASSYDWNNPGFGESTGHFTQVVWKDTTEIGCSMVTCPDGTIWSGYGSSTYHVCEYYTAGNVVGGDHFQNNVGTKN